MPRMPDDAGGGYPLRAMRVAAETALETIETLRPRLVPNPRRDRAWVEEMRAHWRELAAEVWRVGVHQR